MVSKIWPPGLCSCCWLMYYSMLVEGIPFPKSAVDCIFCFVQAGVPARHCLVYSMLFHFFFVQNLSMELVGIAKKAQFLLLKPFSSCYYTVYWVVKEMDNVILGIRLNINKWQTDKNFLPYNNIMDTQDLLNNHAMNMSGQLTWIELDFSSFPEHSGILNIKCKSESFQIKGQCAYILGARIPDSVTTRLVYLSTTQSLF